MERISFEEGIGIAPTAPAEDGVAAGPSLGRMSFEEGTGAAQTFSLQDRVENFARNFFDAEQPPGDPAKPTQSLATQSLGSFLADSSTWEQVGKEAKKTGKNVAAALDIGLGFGAFVARIGVTGASDLYQSAVGEAAPMEATDKIMEKAVAASWNKFLAAPLQETFGIKPEETAVGRTMGNIGESIGGWADSITKATGNPEMGRAFKRLVDAGMIAIPGYVMKGVGKYKAARAEARLTPVTPIPRPGEAVPQLGRPGPTTFDVQGRIVPAAALPPAATRAPTVPGSLPSPAAATGPTAPAAAPARIIQSVIAKQKPGTTLYVARNGDVTTTLGEVVAKRGETSLATYQGLAAAGVASAALWATMPDAGAAGDEMGGPGMLAVAGAALASSIKLLKGKGVLDTAGKIKSEPLLLEALQKAETREAATRALYEAHVPVVTRGLFKFKKQGLDIDAIAHDTVTKFIMEVAPNFRGDSKIGTILYTMAQREAISGYRSKIRAKEEPLDLTETPGQAKGDEGQASPHERIADESLGGRTPEQRLANAQVGDAMARLVDEMPATYRDAWKRHRLEEMSHQESADFSGVPINTIRTQIHRGDQFMKEGLKDYQQGFVGGAGGGALGPRLAVGAGVAGTAALVAWLAEEDAKAAVGGGLAGAAIASLIGRGGVAAPGFRGQGGWVKAGKGGEWHPATKLRLAGELSQAFDRTAMRVKVEAAKKAGATTDELSALFYAEPFIAWSNSTINNWLNRYAGQASDPLKDVKMFNGETWGEVTDKAFQSKKPYEFATQRGLENVSPDADVWATNVAGTWDPQASATNMLQSQLRHVSDYLAANVDPAKLGQYDLVRAALETAAHDAKVAKAAEIARKASGVEELKRMETMPTPMHFADGGRIVQLKNAGDFARESTNMGHSVRGYEPSAARKGDSQAYEARNTRDQLAHPDWLPESETGIRDARFGSGSPSYGATNRGWESIKNGSVQVYSLRDNVGMSHATIETSRDTFSSIDNAQFRAQLTPAENARLQGERYSMPTLVELFGETRLDEIRKILPYSVTQIKGPATPEGGGALISNGPVHTKWQQDLADFLNSREWGDVNLDQSGLIKTSKGVYVTLDAVAKASGVDKNSIETYLEGRGTFNEADGAIIARALNSFEPPSKGTGDGGTPPPRGSGRGEAGKIEADKLLIPAGAAVAGAALAAYFSEDTELAAILGGAAGLTLASAAGRKALGAVVKEVDQKVGLVSTRIQNYSPVIYHRMMKRELGVIKGQYDAIAAGDAFFTHIEKLKGGIIKRTLRPGESPTQALEHALTQNDSGAIVAEVKRMGNPAMMQSWQAMRDVLDTQGAELVRLGRFKRMLKDYFPRVVKDPEGLMETFTGEARDALQTRLKEAERAAMRTGSTGLSPTEASIIINRFLQENGATSFQPGFAKRRTIKEITPDLMKFYHSPVDSYHATVRAQIKDIEDAKFFGKHLKTLSKGGSDYIDYDKSIGTLIEAELNTKKLTFGQVKELESMIRSRFAGGEKGAHPWMQDFKNIVGGLLLGNPVSAMIQYADMFGTAAIYGLRPTLEAIVLQIKGTQPYKAGDIGVVNHVTEEFISTRPSKKFLDWSFGPSVLEYLPFVGKPLGKGLSFGGADIIGKEVRMNAAVIAAQQLAKTPKGVAELHARYGEALGDGFPGLLRTLRTGGKSDPIMYFLFNELNRSQPISPLERSQWAMDNPNGRIFFFLKGWANKQIDFVRRESYNEIKAGHVAKGVGTFLKYSFFMGLGGATLSMMQDWIRGRDTEFSAATIFENALKTYALGEYRINTLKDRGPVAAVTDLAAPPWKIFDEIYRGDPSIVKYIPKYGKLMHDHLMGGKEQAELKAARRKDKELAKELDLNSVGQLHKADRTELSQEAQDYKAAQTQKRIDKRKAAR